MARLASLSPSRHQLAHAASELAPTADNRRIAARIEDRLFARRERHRSEGIARDTPASSESPRYPVSMNSSLTRPIDLVRFIRSTAMASPLTIEPRGAASTVGVSASSVLARTVHPSLTPG